MNNVIHGDCLDIMKGYDDNQFNLCLTDPPYGIDLANMNMGVGKSKKASRIENRKWTPKDWDKETPKKEVFDEMMRISKNQIIWGGNYFELPPCYGYIIWDKEIPKGLSFADCEMAWISFKRAARFFRYSAYLDKRTKVHPTQKPSELFSWILENYTKEGDTIIDPFAGSGTTAISCINMNRKYTLIEKEKEYIDIINKRIENHLDGNLLNYIENE